MSPYPTIPAPEQLARDVAGVCFYPSPRMPRAVYLQPARRPGQPATLVAVVATVKGRQVVSWAEAIVGQVAPV